MQEPAGSAQARPPGAAAGSATGPASGPAAPQTSRSAAEARGLAERRLRSCFQGPAHEDHSQRSPDPAVENRSINRMITGEDPGGLGAAVQRGGDLITRHGG